MKQTHLVAKKEWDILVVLDSSGGYDSFVQAARDEGLVGEAVGVINKFPDRDIWFERNFLQFMDGRNKDVTLVGVNPHLWRPAIAWLLKGAFGDTIPSWQARRLDKNEQALKDAERLWKKSSFDGKIVVQLSGGSIMLPSLASFVQRVDAVVAITAILGFDPLPWLWARGSRFQQEEAVAMAEAGIDEYAAMLAELEAEVVDETVAEDVSIVDNTTSDVGDTEAECMEVPCE